MSHIQYSVGSAFAQALSQTSALIRHEDFPLYRTVDLLNIGKHCLDVAHHLLPADPAQAREHLIHAAGRMLAAADRLDAGKGGPVIVPLPSRAARPNLTVVS